MNAQLANLSFLVLFCSMICYWIGPLSRDLYGNPTLNKNLQKDNGTNYDGFPILSNGSKPIIGNLDSSPLTTSTGDEYNLDSLKMSTGADYTSGRSSEGLSISALLPPEMNSSVLQKTYWYLGEIFNKIRSKFEYRKISFNVNNILQFVGRSGIILANILLMVLLCNRWLESGHFPLSNLYESLMFLSWSFTGIHLFLENLLNSQTLSNQSVGKFIGAITTPSALFTNAFATFTLPKEMQASSSLVPALQSNWLMMHVTVMIISYAALILGSLLSIAYLIITVSPNFKETTPNAGKKPSAAQASVENLQNNFSTNTESFIPTNTMERNEGTNKSKKNLLGSVALTFDNLSYRILGIGFPFLTIGILSGAVWANEAWGSYWSWDPKETWAFLTWLVYAIYLHTRLNKGWVGKKPAIIASLGFIVTWICYLGVNLIGEGLHSYGWIIK